MATTTNFGWTTPDDTALVKDGAAAIRSLGSAIDTSMADLEGGTTGQFLTKNSNTDMDFVWATATSGGMTQIASGTLSGASVALSSIVGTYKDLVLDVLAFDPSDDTTQFGIRLNTDTGSNYYYAATIDNTLGSAETRIEIGGNQDFGTSTAFYRIFIPRYANTTTWKLLWGDALYNDTTSPTTVLRYKRTAATYKSTSAITAITMLVNQGTFSGGTYNLYGVN
jgi:hypothetical protein